MAILADHVPLDSRDWLLSHGVSILIIVVAAFVVLAAARLAVRRMQRRLEGAESETQELNLQRTATLTQALSYMIRILVWTMTILLLLGQFDINLGPLLAGAGIAGVALGFGAQSLVKDFLSGFFILLENQYGVGAGISVNVGGQIVSGKVEGVSLRTTEIRSFDGTLHVIPNGNILYSGNRSKGWSRAIVDVRVALDEDLDRARQTLEELFEEMKAEEAFQGAFFSGPDVLGVEHVGDQDVVLRAAAEVRPTRRAHLERELRVRIKRRFDERGIRAPVAPVTRSDGGAAPGS
jgi:moderate conductance mechanosensitive channel